MPWYNYGPTTRPIATGTRGMVTSAHPLASLAGVRTLLAGGNAIDAAVAVAAALNVVEPYMSGLGGDGYMLVHIARDNRLHALDYVGRSAHAATRAAFADESEKEVGPKAPLVPGAPGGWLAAHERFGSLPLDRIFAPAIEYAEGGVPLTIKGATFYGMGQGKLDKTASATFFPGGRPPVAGEIIRQPHLAATYRALAGGGADEFYRGALGERVLDAIRRAGGLLSDRDLADFTPEWQEPIGTTYRGYAIRTVAPPCSGFQYLASLNLLEGYDLAAAGQNSAAAVHLAVEAFKLAIADRIRYATDPNIPIAGLLAKDYANRRRNEIRPAFVGLSEGERYGGRPGPEFVQAGVPRHDDHENTTHFDVVDAEGNAVSVTQSLGAPFGSGVMAGDTGIMLNNLSYWFDFEPDSPNAIGPHKKIEMCMAPAAVYGPYGQLFMAIGTPGSFGILQTTPQMIANVLDHGYNIQAAIEAPRFRVFAGTELHLEGRFPEEVRADLVALGHGVKVIEDWSWSVGGGHGILIDPDTGTRYGGADPRRDGVALAQ
ncbi:MAG TPA: gamma-glutamyltransferase [Thermomicrobiales bacterium]